MLIAQENNKYLSSKDCDIIINKINLQSKNQKYKNKPNLFAIEVILPSISNYLVDNFGKMSESELKSLINQSIECVSLGLKNKSKLDYQNDNQAIIAFFNSFFSSIIAANSKSSEFSQNLNQTNSNRLKKVCNYCQPSDPKGHYITDYDSYMRQYKNGRYILRPGHVVCSICHGTGNCKAGSCSSYDEDKPCYYCHGDRFIVCEHCKGSGEL